MWPDTASFNPRPAHARGATTTRQHTHWSCRFQSAPRARARGDQASPAPSPAQPRFNPRPALARGATRRRRAAGWNSQVSIRAPRTRAGRQATVTPPTTTSEFQSAPRARARGDDKEKPAVAVLLCFNPRPAHARGATGYKSRLGRSIGVSIRAPRTRAGRRLGSNRERRKRPVSIRAPRTRAGRHTLIQTTGVGNLFQSAPRARARGDQLCAQNITNLYVFQSAPRARARGDGGTYNIVNCRIEFQSAPRARARGDLLWAERHQLLCCFNPRPAHARGATFGCHFHSPAWLSFNPRPAHARGATSSAP